MNLTYEQKRQLFEHGYVKVPNVVPQVMVDAALKAINHSLGEGIDPEQVHIFRQRSYAPELQKEPVITDLLTGTPAFALAESAIGRGKVTVPSGGQIRAALFRRRSIRRPRPAPIWMACIRRTMGYPKGQFATLPCFWAWR